MNQLVPIIAGPALPAIVASADDRGQLRFVEFFTVTNRNPNTRKAYARAAGGWSEARGVPSIAAVQPLHVAAYIEELTETRSVPTASQRLAAIRHLFDWPVTGQIVPTKPAGSVR